MFQWMVLWWDGKRNGGGLDPSYVVYAPVLFGFPATSTSIWMIPGTWQHD